MFNFNFSGLIEIIMIKKFITFLAFLLFIAINLSAQDSFQVLFESTNDKGVGYIMEDINGNFLAVGSEADPLDGIYDNKIWKISSSGDTSNLLKYNELIILEADTLFNKPWLKKYIFSNYLGISELRVLRMTLGITY